MKAHSWNEEDLSLCEAVDRILHKGVVIHGEVIISVADVDLIYLGISALLSSVETATAAGLPLPSKQKRIKE
jgi:hypothetical protein